MNLNSANAKSVTVKAKWCQTTTDFSYAKSIQTFTPTCIGYYKLEVWGASGGGRWNHKVDNVKYNSSAGAGGYAVGIYNASSTAPLYVVVGGEGQIKTCTSSAVCPTTSLSGGYNGGGDTGTHANSQGGGGGATHIATVSGLLKDLSSYKNTGGTNISKEILIVAGGGGGSDDSSRSDNPSDTEGYGAIGTGTANDGGGGNGGGYMGQSGERNGSSSNSNSMSSRSRQGGTQTAGYAFGLGETGGTGSDFGAGGGGWYGGYSGSEGNDGGGGGSGYIGSLNLLSSSSITKHMTCYKCSASTTSNIYTISSGTVPSITATVDVAKAGDGYARITYLGISI